MLLWLTMLGFVLSLPTLGLVFRVDHLTEQLFGFGARSIAIFDAAATSPLDQLSMIPLLTLIAIYAPSGHRATWFALMASLMNLALMAGALLHQISEPDLSGGSRRLRQSAGAGDGRNRDQLRAAALCDPAVRTTRAVTSAVASSATGGCLIRATARCQKHSNVRCRLCAVLTAPK